LISFPVNIARATSQARDGDGDGDGAGAEASQNRNGKHKQLWQAIKVMLRNAAGISMHCS